MAVLPPMPNARVQTAMAAKPGERAQESERVTNIVGRAGPPAAARLGLERGRRLAFRELDFPRQRLPVAKRQQGPAECFRLFRAARQLLRIGLLDLQRQLGHDLAFPLRRNLQRGQVPAYVRAPVMHG